MHLSRAATPADGSALRFNAVLYAARDIPPPGKRNFLSIRMHTSTEHVAGTDTSHTSCTSSWFFGWSLFLWPSSMLLAQFCSKFVKAHIQTKTSESFDFHERFRRRCGIFE